MIIHPDVMTPVEIWNLEQSKKLTTFHRPYADLLTRFDVFLIQKDFCS